MRRVLLILFIYSLGLVCPLFHSLFVFSQETNGNSNAAAAPVAVLSPENITVSGFIDRLELFENEKDPIKKSIKALPSIKTYKQELTGLTQNFKDYQITLQEKRKLSSWNSLKLDAFLARLQELTKTKDSLRNLYLSSLEQSEKLLEELKAKETFFKKSYRRLQGEELIREQSTKLEETLKFLEKRETAVNKRRTELSQLYQEYTPLFREMELLQEELQDQQENLQNALWTQAYPSFLTTSFWAPFKEEAHKELPLSWKNVAVWNKEGIRLDLPNYLWLLLIFLISFMVLRRLHKRYDFPPPPFDLSVLLTFLAGYFLLEFPPSWSILLAWLMMPWLLFRTVNAYNLPHQASHFLLKLFIAYSLIRIVEIIDFPISLYRIFLASFGGIVGLYTLLRHHYVKKKKVDSLWGHWLTVPVGLLFLVAMFSEIFGYHLFANLVIHGTIKSSFLIFGLLFFRRFANQFLSFLFHLPVLENIRLLKQNRRVFLRQISHLLQAGMVLWAILILPTLWQIYPNIASSGDHIFSMGISLADKKISLGNLVAAIFFFYLAHLIAFFLCALLKDEVYPRKQIERGVANSINSLVKYTLWFLGITFAFFALGFEMKQLAIIAGALSVGIGFGLQNIVNNFVSGIILLFERPVKVGDLLDIQNEWGEVEKVGLRSTIVRTLSKTQLIIPNSDFITQKVTNLTLSDQDYRISLVITVAYGTEIKKAQKILEEILKSHPMIMSNPSPLVFLSDFGENAIKFQLFLWVTDVNKKLAVTSDVLYAIDEKFRQGDIKIPFPQRDLHLSSVSQEVMEAFKRS